MRQTCRVLALNMGDPRRRKRPGAEQGRRNAHYLACDEPARVRSPITLECCVMLRHSDGKMRRDGIRAARVQPDFAVDERGRLHGTPGLSCMVECRGLTCIRGLVTTEGDERRMGENAEKTRP